MKLFFSPSPPFMQCCAAARAACRKQLWRWGGGMWIVLFAEVTLFGAVSLQFCSSPIVASKETVSLCWSRVKVRKWGYQRRDKVNSQLIVQKHSWFVLIAVFAFTFVCVTSVSSLSRWCHKILFCATSYNKRKSVTTKHEQRFCIYADEKKKEKNCRP